MTETAEILEAALKLNETEREHLVEALAMSLYGKDLGGEWEAEIQRRIADLDDGTVVPVPGPDVFEKLEQRFGDR